MFNSRRPGAAGGEMTEAWRQTQVLGANGHTLFDVSELIFSTAPCFPCCELDTKDCCQEEEAAALERLEVKK